MNRIGGRIAAGLALWLGALGSAHAVESTVPSSDDPVVAVVDPGFQKPFRSVDACLTFASGGAHRTEDGPAANRICTKIDQLWQAPNSAGAADDNPLQLDLRQNLASKYPVRGSISGDLLARFLTLPNLLPPRITGGLVLENLEIKGTLELDDATVGFPVAIREAGFRPDKETILEDHLAFVAIRLDRTRFVAGLEIAQSDIQGHVLIDGSRFPGGLALSEVVISTRSTAPLGPVAAQNLGRAAALRMRNTTVDSGLLIHDVLIFNPRGSSGRSAELQTNMIAPRLDIGGLYAEGGFAISRSNLGQFSLSDFQFGGNFMLGHNRISRLRIAEGRFSDTLSISNNQAIDSFDMLRFDIYLKDGDVDPEIAVNQVEGRFLFLPAHFNDKVERIDLTYNHVAGLASVVPPAELSAELDLSNVKMATRLEVGKSYWERPGPDADLLFQPKAAVDAECPETDGSSTQLINLTNASLDIFVWNFPIRCDVRWDGAGLAYRYWGDPDLKGGQAQKTDGDFVELLKRWRFTAEKPNSEALGFMANYLNSRGQFSDSRDLRQEAKEVNYRPHADDLDTVWGWVAYAWSWVVYGLLWPTGFGVKPELALLWLFVGWVICALAYHSYSRRQRGWAPNRRQPGGLSDEGAAFAGAGFEVDEQPSRVPGFMQYDRDRRPADFSLWAFSADAMLPVVNLHAYTEYYPKHPGVRFLTFAQHIVGWWMLSIFLASATVL